MASDLNIADVLTRRFHGVPIYLIAMGLGAGGYILFKLRSGGASSILGGSSNGPSGQFTSSQSQSVTDPNTGVTTTSDFSASGDSFLPGFLTTQGNPMPFSAGDVYVNVTAPTNTSTGGSGLKTVPYVVTGKGDDNIAGLIKNFFKVSPKDTVEQSLVANAVLSVNPPDQRNEQHWGSHIPVGTQINLPAEFVQNTALKQVNGQNTVSSNTKPIL